MKVQLKTLSQIRPYENNPRQNDEAVDAVAASIQEFGFRQPIVVDERRRDHRRPHPLQGGAEAGLEQVPVHVATDLTPAQVKAYRIADNQTADIAEWDYELLPHRTGRAARAWTSTWPAGLRDGRTGRRSWAGDARTA